MEPRPGAPPVRRLQSEQPRPIGPAALGKIPGMAGVEIRTISHHPNRSILLAI